MFEGMRRLVCLALAAGLIAGCSPSSVKVVPVRGKVTFQGGACPAPGRLVFVPTSSEPDKPHRLGHGDFGADGVFSAKSLPPREGLIPGEYEVRLECWKSRPDELTKGVSYVPSDFHIPNIVVEPGSAGLADLTIDVPADSVPRSP